MKHLDRTHILTRIVEAMRKRLQVSRTRVPEAVVKRMAETAKPVSSFREALGNAQRVRIMAEVHDETELREALEAGASIIGVNNRDLKTFDVSLDTSLHLGKLIPDDRLFVVESGIHKKDDVDLLLDAGADAFLIGEHLLTAP